MPAFITIEQETEMRILLRNVLKNEGLMGMLQCVGEIGASYRIGLELIEEHFEERMKP